MDNIKLLKSINKDKDSFYNELNKVIIGQKEIVEHIFIAILCKGHILLEGVPGLGKTLIIKTISDIMDLKFSRIQFTPDLMPSDITGSEIITKDSEIDDRAFKFIKGPIFSNIILADEINRTPPKTQAALLEAMQEGKVTVGGQTYDIGSPVFVMATQNPIEQEGTYPLPEAQLDRFMFNVVIDYPPYEDEINIVKNNTSMASHTLSKIIDSKNLLEYQKLVLNIPVSDNLIEYAVKLVHNTRPNHESSPDITKKYINWGAGPRASTYLILAAKAKAVLSNKPTPDIDDIISVVKPVLRHRIIPNFNAEAEGIKRDDILDELLESI
ncbi:MAG: AAA family ATPase [Candidatus Marinimicrobia bacterium]|nr:AAA family ATPase [Candidatus Neomarinimicrobiota bacterium]|tara:strand:+ start:14878 stop:15855 length:978 start_codon:yes stop_codon:yes gene_type:complete